MENEQCSLENKACVPCTGGVPPLPESETKKLLQQVKGWKINSAGHLHKEYQLKDFVTALALTNKIGEIAEKEGHHPDITLTWGKCSIEIWTHKINGLTESDFILAAKIDHIR